MVGEGILKGLAETARNFFGSYVDGERLTTVQFPEQRLAPIEATRDFPFWCMTAKTGTQECAASRARSARRSARRSVSTSRRARTRSRTLWARRSSIPAKFDIDISVCMSCQICVEVWSV